MQSFKLIAVIPTLLIFSILNQKIAAQQPIKLVVTRCGAVEKNSPIRNLWVNADGSKLVTNSRGVHKVGACDLGSPSPLTQGEVSAAQFHGGNMDFRWNAEAIFKITKQNLNISSAWVDMKNDLLILGTKDAGVYRIKLTPSLKLVDNLTVSNTKLKSNEITSIYLDNAGRYWIGTPAGLMTGTPGKWRSELDGYDIQRIRQVGNDVAVLADGEFWRFEGGEKVRAINVVDGAFEGEPEDFDIAPDGSLWILTKMLTRYDLNTDQFQTFSGPQDYTSEFGVMLAADPDGGIWVATEDKGLYLVEKASNMTVNILIEKDLSCDSKTNDATLRVKITGGNPPFYYSWVSGLSGDNPTGLGPGKYSVTVSDKSGNSKTATAEIANPSMRLKITQKKEESAPGAANAVAEVGVEGGQKPYSYAWDNGETNHEAIKLTEGKHTVTVTDQKGCKSTATVNVSQKLAAMTVNIKEKGGIRCAGLSEAALEVEVLGGKPPYKFDWSDPALTGQMINGLAAGQYTVSVTDAVNTKAAVTYLVKQPDNLTLKLNPDASATPGNDNGKATAKASGGAGKYDYRWDNGETTAQAVKLSAGKHGVTVTDANGCSLNASVEIKENISPLSVSVSEKNAIKCAGEKTGALAVEISGGKAPYKFDWSNPAASGQTPGGLAAGIYELTVTDAAGNKTNANGTVKEPEKLTATIRTDAPAGVGKTDGKATVRASGGAGKYDYRWDNGETTAQATKLPPGGHTVTVTDANGCTTTSSVDVTENISPLSASISEKKSIKCAGGNDAALDVAVVGGKAPFKFEWSGGSVSGQTPGGLAAGSYNVVVTDAASNKTTATITVKEPEKLAASARADAPASTGKPDGKASVKTTGGAGKYDYKWDNGETAVQATRLAPGKHSVTVTDANGCITTSSVEISENIQPLSVSISEKKTIKCAGEKDAALEVEVSGGKAPFQFDWGGGGASGQTPGGLAAGTYNVVVTDAASNKTTATVTVKEPEKLAASARTDAPASTGKPDGKASVKASGGAGKYDYKWDNGETALQATKLAPGKHSVTVTDANGCTSTTSVEISENILPLSVSISEKKTIKCAGEKDAALEVEVSGGKAPFKFDWSGGSASGQTPSSLAAGVYVLTVTDAAGTKTTATANVKEPENLGASARSEAAASTGNSDGKASIRGVGGAGKYDYKWDNGETTAQATRLAPGKHTVTVTDANGCTSTTSVEISENVQPLTASISEKSGVRCAGQSTGELDVQVNGGKAPYKFAWNNPKASGQAPSGLSGGSFTVTVTDSKGTTSTANHSFRMAEPILAEITKNTGATTDKTRDGRATVVAKGGAGGFRFAWDSGETGEKATQLTLGSHKVTITDAQGCEKVLSFETGKRILPELNASMLKAGQNVRMEQLQFEADSTNINESCLPVLSEVYDFLSENGGIVIEIGGHTNSTPPDAYCDKLSSGRAKAVADHLISRGIDPKRVFFKGYGKRQPVAPNTTPEGRKKNQRVEIKILKIE